MANNFQQVELYLSAMLPLLENLDPIYSLANKQFDNFSNIEFSYGGSVSFDLPNRFQVVNSLDVTGVASAINQRKQNLVVDKSWSGTFSVNSTEFWQYQTEDWIPKYGRSMVAEIGSKFGKDVSNVAKDYTYRTFGDGVTPLNSVKQIHQIIANYRNYGSAAGQLKMILPDIIIPDIVNDGLNQFVLNRNEEYANSWELGSDTQCKYYKSNFLPTHNAGTAGNNTDPLTITNIIDATGPSGETASQLTIDGITVDAGAFQTGDIITLDPNANYTPVLSGASARFLTFIGHELSSQKVQVRVLADADAVAGTATVTVFPRLVSDATNSDQNVNFDITSVTGGNPMEASALPDHVCGVIWSANPVYCATPKLPQILGFDSSSQISSTGVGMRLTAAGNVETGVNQWVWNLNYGYSAVDEYMMRIAIPINQGL